MVTMLGAWLCAVNMAAMLGARFAAVAGARPLARSSVSAAAVANGGAQMAIRSHGAERRSRIVSTMRLESASQYSGSSRMELREPRSDRLTCAMHVLAYRRRGDVEHGRNLGNVESTVDDEIEALPLHVGQPANNGRNPIERVPSRGQLRRISPTRLWPPPVQQPAAARSAPPIFGGHAPNDAVEPGPDRLARSKRRGPIERDHERLSHDILGVIRIADELSREQRGAPDVPTHQVRGRRVIAGRRPTQKRAVIRVTHVRVAAPPRQAACAPRARPARTPRRFPPKHTPRLPPPRCRAAVRPLAPRRRPGAHPERR